MLVLTISLLVFSIPAIASYHTDDNEARIVDAEDEEYVIGDQRTPVEIPIMNSEYEGAAECAQCHSDIYNDWSTTGHNYILMTPEQALDIRPDLPFPDGYTQEDISYVIGGWGWKARYLDSQGFFVTKTGSDLEINGSNQYNLATGEWVDYHAGEQLQYNCQRCHTTGAFYNVDTDGLEGTDGAWVFEGVQCEACHGPGSIHIDNMLKGSDVLAIDVNSSAELCGECHIRGSEEDKIPASKGFVNHHEQYQEFLASGKLELMDCVVCHDPHKPVHLGATNDVEGAGIIAECADCHGDAVLEYEGSAKQIAGIECVDCHMPKNVRSAVNTSMYVGDIRSHLFRINTDVDAKFTFIDPGDGKEYANPFITVEYACLSCHEGESKEWAALNAPGMHSLETVMIPDGDEVPAEELPSEDVPGFESLFASLILVMVYIFRRR